MRSRATTVLDGRSSPYQGLVPFEEGDYGYFFGRRRDIERVIANLQAWRLSLLYGVSGVGKTSILKAGAAVTLQREARESLQIKREVDVIPVVFNNWKDDPRPALKAAIRNAVQHLFGDKIVQEVWRDGEALGPGMQRLTDLFRSRIVLILDQFEEFFLYHPGQQGPATFAREFTDLLGHPEYSTHVLISIREDSIAKLDRFKYDIPSLFDNYLRLEHLDLDGAREAIEQPVETWNREFEHEHVRAEIEKGLADEVLAQLVEMETRGIASQPRSMDGKATGDKQPRIEATLLQLVLQRLWEHDTREGSGTLERSTLKTLGGALQITRTHLDRTLATLSAKEQRIAASLFDRLVTPSKTKIAQTTVDLATYARETYAKITEAEVENTLRKLAAPNVRVLRTVEPPLNQPDLSRYEIFHDALAEPILKHIREQKATEHRKRRRLKVAVLGGISLAIVLLLAARSYSLWLDARPWGYVEELWTGKTHPLTGNLASVGRNAKDYIRNNVDIRLPANNRLGISPNVISRAHLFITQDLRAMDLRTLNGTIVNGEILPYGTARSLDADDLIVLAGAAPLRFRLPRYAWYQFWTPNVTGAAPPNGASVLFIDGEAKKVTYLTESTSYLVLAPDGAFGLSSEPSPKWLAKILVHPDRDPEIVDRRDPNTLRGRWKASDYAVVECALPSDLPVAGLDWDPRRCRLVVQRNLPDEKLRSAPLGDMALSYGERRFQLAPILRPVDGNGR